MLVINYKSNITTGETMLSYQHIYHAGNLADVHKHTILSILLSEMIKKDKPLTYMETHAGRGLYNLNSEESLKTGEANKGIKNIHNNNLHPPYALSIDKIKKLIGEDYYPGSPMIARLLLRDTDNLNFMELHPQEHKALQKNMSVFANCHIHRRDGYEGVLAISPPSPRRGLVLIDPSYEVKKEYEQVSSFIKKLHKKWAEAVIMLWYPILKEGLHEKIKDSLKVLELPKFFIDEQKFKELPKENGMLGSGIIIINTPFGTIEEINKWI